MDYDVLILGGGVIGCATAYELSKYNLNIALIEKEHDIANDIAFVDVSLVYKGILSHSEEMANLQIKGNDIITELVNTFDIVYKESILDIINIDNSGNNNMNNKALIISPYDLALAFGEIAYDNGVNFRLEEKSVKVDRINDGFRVTTNKAKFTCRKIINTTSKNYEYEKEFSNNKISTGHIKYLLMEKSYKKYRDKAVIKFIGDEILYLIPSPEGNLIIGLKSVKNISYEDMVDKIRIWGIDFNEDDIKDFFQYNYFDDVLKGYNNLEQNYIKVVGKNFTEATLAPAIANKIAENIRQNIGCTKKSYFNESRRESYKFRFLSNIERNKLIHIDKKFGKIICTCNLVTEAEIVDAIRRPLGARTVEAIIRRTGAGNGQCRGCGCYNKIVSILARETNKKMTSIVKNTSESNVILNRIKEFDSI
ncbi:FAD-dependent oxidoreductase [Clostridium sediminicola]|uniref:FAD-dependent oxidoreductase n=1 Tax=Clostridium sediminicola TaxID=3114879 RepID=UPI0031F1CF47